MFVPDRRRFFYRFTHLFVILLLLFIAFNANAAQIEPQTILNLRTAGDKNFVRVIAVTDHPPSYSLQMLANPPRLVLNFPTSKFSFNSNDVRKNGFVKNIQIGSNTATNSRIIIETDTPFLIANTGEQKLEDSLWQITLDLVKTSQPRFKQALADQWKRVAYDDNQQANRPPHAFRVVLDPGHGGIDSGAKGISGVLEKNVTLAFARELRNALEREPGITVSLTRDSDVFLRLNERVEKARAFGADLFISIHADTIGVPYLRGATVYTLSDKASDDVARDLAETENKSDLVDGLPPDETPEVTDILIDLTRRETHIFSVNFANKVIATLSANSVNLIRNPQRSAGFKVLKAADIPSVLIELGYLSNRKDEKLVSDARWRAEIAKLIAQAIRKFSDYRSGITVSN